MKYFGTRLLVSDYPAALAFWRDVMKLPLKYSDEVMGYAYFEADNVALELFDRAEFTAALGLAAPTAPPAGHPVALVFKVDDVDATYADLVAQGAAPLATPQDRPAWMARTAHVGAPDGYIIEIYSSLPATDIPTA
jgi:lactoylglutathione lyase